MGKFNLRKSAKFAAAKAKSGVLLPTTYSASKKNKIAERRLTDVLVFAKLRFA